MTMERKCTNCAFCERISYGVAYVPKEKWPQEIRCWEEPGVCDHAFVISLKEAENYVCENHRTEEEHEAELFEHAKVEIAHYKARIKELEEKYPELKED